VNTLRRGVVGDHIVAIQKCEQLAARHAGPRVAGGAQAAVALLDQTEAAVARTEARRDLGAAVARAVVDHDDLEVLVGLARERL
jgi:hypothetical protein